MPIPNFKKFLSEDPLDDTDSSNSDYDPNSDEESTSSEEEEEEKDLSEIDPSPLYFKE